MTRYFRRLIILLLAIWAIATAIALVTLSQDDFPLIQVSVSSYGIIAWAIGTLVVGVLVLFLATRSPQRRHLMQQTALLGYVSAPLIIITRRGRVIWHNDAAGALVGTQSIVKQLRDAAQKLQNDENIGIQVLNTDNETSRYSVQLIPLDRRRVGIIGRSIESSQAQHQFYERFIRHIVHDMRNPLAAIIGHAANLHDAPDGHSAQLKESATTIEQEARRVAKLVDSMLFDARLAYVPLELAQFDLSDVVEEALYSQDEAAAKDGKSIEIEASPSPMPFRGDRDLLLRAFTNLIDNGVKFTMPNHGRIIVRLQHQPNGYTLTFLDNGSGIPKEYLPERIFEPMVRAHAKVSGSGLGLSIVKKIVEMHQGTISVKSDERKGTAFIIHLPKEQA